MQGFGIGDGLPERRLEDSRVNGPADLEIFSAVTRLAGPESIATSHLRIPIHIENLPTRGV